MILTCEKTITFQIFKIKFHKILKYFTLDIKEVKNCLILKKYNFNNKSL